MRKTNLGEELEKLAVMRLYEYTPQELQMLMDQEEWVNEVAEYVTQMVCEAIGAGKVESKQMAVLKKVDI